MTEARPFLVGGAWRRGAGRSFRSVDPADGSVAAVIASAEPGDVDDAVAAARAAVEAPAWRDLLPHQRATLLRRLADLVDRDGERLATLQMRDNGKTAGECRSQVASAVATARYYAAVCESTEAELTPPRGDFISMATYEPIGVVAAITPWNSPLTIEMQKLAPALAAGNAVILKPSEVTPQVALEYGRLALEAGFPPGVVNVLTGFGPEVGQALVSHRGVDLVTFTGGTETGRRIAAMAGERIVPVILELGGKSPNVVFDDADLEQALAGAIYGIFSSGGQSCIAGSRIFVQAAVYDIFVERLVAAAGALQVGPPTDPATAVGPIATAAHRDHIERAVAAAIGEGAVLLCGGRRPADPALAGGAYYAPTVLAVPSNRLAIARDEVFGPVAAVLRFSDEDDLVRQANDSDYGLACGLWTGDYRRAFRVARRIRAGTVWINTYKQQSIATPFGGMKASGLWREKGVQGMRVYMAEKSIYLGLAATPVRWP